ncbi:competence protein ComEC [Herbihabitans rhizosphaerae]|uniref:Competence protein ComEC n=1 Tax=Herbihabitans rhizosphaerae TaxID=1872711 RepID=A0A4Q7KEW7_9PSEU|nr:DNA internalization-related competence protein ComEC/Rec2 [Herbihabitans rhizosphaerae]RZS31410.1 competence protein ComEC [Herbihabitans rhizosphaerae]
MSILEITGTRERDDPAARVDWRLVPAAIVVWAAALLGLLVDWRCAALVGAAGFVVGVAVLARRAGRHSVWRRWIRRGAGWSLLLCGLASIAPLTLTLREAREDPLRAPAAAGSAAHLRVSISERPRPVFASGFGGRQGGVQAVVLSAQVRHARVADREVDSDGRVLLVAPAEKWADLLPGHEVEADGLLTSARPGELTVAALRVRGPPRVINEAPVWQRVADRLRDGLRAASGVLSPESAGLLPALVVGDTDSLPRRVIEEFRTTGMSHLLAVSGTNLAIVCVAVLLLLRAFRVGPRGAAVGSGLALVGFVVLAGPEPSVLRAGAMAAVGLIALALGRQRMALPALAASVIVLVLFDPALAVDFGFALSVLATGGLVLVAPRWADSLAARGMPRGIAEALAVPAAAHVVTAPVVAGMSGQVSVIAVLANLLAAPVVAPATVLGVLAALCAPVAPWLAEALVHLAGPEVWWLIMVGRHGAAVPGAAFDWPGGWWGGLLLMVLTVVTLAALRNRKLRVIVAAALTGLLIVLIPVRVIAPDWPPDGWTVAACDVGQGDAIVVATGERGSAVVVDTGPEAAPVAGCLGRLGVSDVPLLVLSHLHADHIGGLTAVLADRRVAAVAVGPVRAPEWAWHQVRGEAARAGVPVVQLGGGQRLSWPGLSIDVLGPAERVSYVDGEVTGTEINNGSLVLRAQTGAGSVLLTGDVELLAQAELLSSGVDLTADVLKVPHHGSRYTAPEFLAAIRPKIALISSGAGNRYGHPSPATVGQLTSGGAAVYRTDTGGDTAVVPGDTGPRAVARGSPRAPPR